MSDNLDNDALAAELEERAYTAIAYILRSLAHAYAAKTGDTLLVNDTLLRTISQMTGEMIACYPDEEQEAAYDAVTETITYSQDMMSLELAEREKATETSDEEPVTDPAARLAAGYDLANMKPQGNC